MSKLKKCAMMTDVHFGRRSNSEEHNKDCYNFVEWFCDQVKLDKTIDHVFFLGDWHEHRSAINGQTLDYSYRAAKLLNSLDMPIFFITGNHDHFFRNSRDIFTTSHFDALTNIIIINSPTEIDEIHGGVLACPYLFHDEYPSILKYTKQNVMMLHAEFAGFVVTGETNVMKHGPDHNMFKNKKRIFSGHFHKRQQNGNVMYIGNTFPMDYSDANDNDRGATFYDYVQDQITHKAWPNAPIYIKCKLSDVMDENSDVLKKGARVKCTVDVDVTYSESIELKNILTTEFNLKELFFEEQTEEMKESLEDTIINAFHLNTESTSELVKSMLTQINNNNIDNDLLVKIYEGKA
jgi:DNA repair exonuclease SbcCD nuclease subunit